MEININEYSTKELLRITKDKAPCSICVIQNTCTVSEKCEPYKEYKRKREKNYVY